MKNNVNPLIAIQEGLQRDLRVLKNFRKGGGATKEQARKALERIGKSATKSAEKAKATDKLAKVFRQAQVHGNMFPKHADDAAMDYTRKAWLKNRGSTKNMEKAWKAIID